MTNIWIKSENGKPLARIKIERSGYQQMFGPNGQHLGSYNPKSNTTHYPNGGMFCCGNALAALLAI